MAYNAIVDTGHFESLIISSNRWCHPLAEMLYFKGEDDLLAKIREFHHDDAKRQVWAKNARDFFHTEMNSKLNAQYILEASLQIPFSHDYAWARDINLDGSMK